MRGSAAKAVRVSDSRGTALTEYTEYGDSDLMAFVADHSELALAALYDRFAPVAYGLALRILRERELAEDAVQEAFLSIWRSAVTFDSRKGSARSWILTVVHRRSVDLVRRNERYREQENQLQVEPLSPSAPEIAEHDGERRAVQAALAALTAKQRTVLELAYYGGYTQSEIATRIGLPIGTIKSQTFEALRRLQQLLESMSPPSP